MATNLSFRRKPSPPKTPLSSHFVSQNVSSGSFISHNVSSGSFISRNVSHWSFIAVLFLLLVPSKAYAANTDIVINEVFPNPEESPEDNEFIELYNKGSETIIITGWKISDTQGSTNTFTIPEESIPAGGYKSFRKSTTGITLNNDSDGVVLKDSSDQQIDSVSYTSTIEGKSWSRIPNGTGSLTNNTDPTENGENSPPPTPTPTNTPPPTHTPTPTKTPTPIPTTAPSSTNTPTPTKKLTPTPTLASADRNSSVEAKLMGNTAARPQGSVQGAGIELGKDLKELDKKETSYNWGKLLILMGAVLVTCASGILVYNNYLKERIEEARGEI